MAVVDHNYNDHFHRKHLLLYGDFTYLPTVVPLRDVDDRVLAVLPVTETLRHARRQTPVVNAAQSARGVFPGDQTERFIGESDHDFEVGDVAHETVSGDSDRERRLQLDRDLCLNDKSLDPANVLRLRSPPAWESRERVHVRRGQGQTRVVVDVVETPHHFHLGGRVENGRSWNKSHNS